MTAKPSDITSTPYLVLTCVIYTGDLFWLAFKFDPFKIEQYLPALTFYGLRSQEIKYIAYSCLYFMLIITPTQMGRQLDIRQAKRVH